MQELEAGARIHFYLISFIGNAKSAVNRYGEQNTEVALCKGKNK